MTLVDKHIWSRNHTVFENGTMSRGVTTTIRKLFAPCFKFNALRARPKGGGVTRSQARKKGHLIDHEIGLYINNVHSTDMFCKETKYLIDYISTHGLTPLWSQKVVGWMEARIATCIDLICRDTSNTYVIVELKYGCAYRECSTGKLLRHVIAHDDSLLHQHQLQLLLTRVLFEKTYGFRPLMLLLYTDTEGVVPYTENTFGVQWTDKASEILCMSAVKKTQRNRNKTTRLKQTKNTKQNKKSKTTN